MKYYIIYDGQCNLCVNAVRLLENLDQGKIFSYVPMQDEVTLTKWGITSQDCQQGMILIDESFTQRWQGSDAIEEVGRLLPTAGFVDLYRGLPGAKWLGDRFYEQIRDNRYALFGKREIYQSIYCVDGGCNLPTNSQTKS
jgi:predicted DCC family thiol-disulfide oxidoreductase YuxK